MLLFASVNYSGAATDDVAVTDEKVIALVEQTAQAIEENVFQTLARINRAEHPYKDQDNPALYVFVFDTEVTLRAHPFKTENIGKSAKGKTDIKGRAFRDEFIAVARKDGSGWVDYYYENPKTQKTEHKRAFVKLVKGSDGNEYVVGCGKYVDE